MRAIFMLGAASLLSGPTWAQVVAPDEQTLVLTCLVIERPDQIIADDVRDPGCDPLDEIVSVGTRIGTSDLDDLTSPATIITRDEIAARGQTAVADILRSVPSLSVNASGPSTGLTQLRLRGAEANHVVVLIDGVEVANPADGGFDFGGLRAQNVARIEVLRGEQSALYGSDALAGVVNIITDVDAARETWRASVEAGSRDTLDGQVSAVVPLGDARLAVTGGAYTTAGYDVSGTSGERDGAKSRSIGLGLNGVEAGPLSLSAHIGTTRRDTAFDEDANFDGRLDDTDSETRVRTRTARLDARMRTGDVDWLASASRLDTRTDTHAGFSTITTGERDQFSLIGRYGTSVHSFTALGEYEREEYSFDGDPDTPDNNVWGVAGDYRFDGGALSLTGSARYDANDLFEDSLAWRAGTGYATGLGRFTASVGTAVKNPTLIELFGFFPAQNFTGNPDLAPETSIGVDLGWALDLDDVGAGDGRLAVTVFRSELEDEIVTLFNPDFTTSLVNLDTDSTRQGVEVEGRYSLGAVDLRGSVSVLDSEQDGREEIRRPGLIASAGVTWRARDDVRASVFVDHNGSQLDTDFATFSDVELDAFTLVGAKAEWDVSDLASLYLRGENLLDENYEEVVGYRSPGRSVFVGLRLGK